MPPQRASTAGLVVWPRGDRAALVSADRQGALHLFDGAHEQLALSTHAVRWPLIVADFEDAGAMQVGVIDDRGELITVREHIRSNPSTAKAVSRRKQV